MTDCVPLSHILEILGEDAVVARLKDFVCRAVRLDCKDELVDYYRGYGFLPIRKDLDSELVQMVCMI